MNYLKGYRVTAVRGGTLYFSKNKQIKESQVTGQITCVEFKKTSYNKLAIAIVTINHKRYTCYNIKEFKKLVSGNKVTGTVREWAYKPGRTLKNVTIQRRNTNDRKRRN